MNHWGAEGMISFFLTFFLTKTKTFKQIRSEQKRLLPIMQQFARDPAPEDCFKGYFSTRTNAER